MRICKLQCLDENDSHENAFCGIVQMLWVWGSILLAWKGCLMKLSVCAVAFRCLSSCCIVLTVGLVASHSPTANEGNASCHLFILSGQSNMAGMRPEDSFIPDIEKVFGKEHVLVVKDAHGGQPIRRWYREWEAADGSRPDSTGDLYQLLMDKVQAAIIGKEIQTVTFVWMQGERDAAEKCGEIYTASLEGLLQQLSNDLKRDDINVVIGRLSDFDMKNAKYPHWTLIREQQAAFFQNGPRRSLVNTDDLNDGENRRGKKIKDDLHYSASGYVELGKRFAQEAIQLIEASDGVGGGR